MTKNNSKFIYNPRFLTNSKLPLDRNTVNAWCRSFVALEPAVHKTIEFYSIYSSKFLQIKYPSNKSINKFFNSQVDRIKLQELLPDIIRQYLTLGECFIYAELDEPNKMWSNLLMQNPDYIIVKSNIYADNSIFLRPDEKLRTLVLKENLSEKEMEDLAKLDKSIIEYIKKGENIPLSNFFISCFIRKQSPYETRGVSILLPVLRKLAILEKIRTIGKEWNHVLSDQIILEQEIKQCIGHPDFVTSNNIIAKEIASNRILQLADMMQQWMEKKIFTPIAKINDFYEYKDGNKSLITPKVILDSKKLHAALDKDCST